MRALLFCHNVWTTCVSQYHETLDKDFNFCQAIFALPVQMAPTDTPLRGIYMFHWLLVAAQALKSVLPVAESFSNKEMRTFSHIHAQHQCTSETINTSSWNRKTKPTSINYFAVLVLAPNKARGSFPWRVSVFCVVEHCLNKLSSQCLKYVSFFKQYSRTFPVYWLM